MCSYTWLIMQTNTLPLLSRLCASLNHSHLLFTSISLGCICLSPRRFIWAQCQRIFFPPFGYSASVADLACGGSGCCCRPGADSTVRAWKLWAPSETQRLLLCLSKEVMADMLAGQSKLGKKSTYNHSLNKPWGSDFPVAKQSCCTDNTFITLGAWMCSANFMAVCL